MLKWLFSYSLDGGGSECNIEVDWKKGVGFKWIKWLNDDIEVERVISVSLVALSKFAVYLFWLPNITAL